jgi:hypothetical protein
MYSASTIESDVDVCFLLNHATGFFPMKNDPPMVLFLSYMLSDQFASIYAVRLKYLSFGYHNPSSRVL